ncbi:DNA-binding protein HU, partial [Pseudomonas aeruginosa]
MKSELIDAIAASGDFPIAVAGGALHDVIAPVAGALKSGDSGWLCGCGS